MALASGTQLGPYEIVAPLGAGGMGEVYRARDARLGRDVAIKVLPPAFAQEPERLRRFEREARAVAGLNHPNILAIYDVGERNGSPYLVTELLSGRNLREQMAGGALPRHKAIQYAIQIARGLAAAHSKGIIHRDLKPENLFVTNEGHIKILDFGLAKVIESAASAASLTDTRTSEDVNATQAGHVLGTVGYMSPEQVTGQPLDHRSDLFSFGAILFEMLSGRRAFQRDSQAETISAILRDEPPEFGDPDRAVPPGLERIVRHCLEKNPMQRFQSATDLAFDLESLTVATQSQPLAAAISPVRSYRWIPLVGLLLLLGSLGAWWLANHSRSETARTVLFDRLTDFVGIETAPAISPDGKSVVFAADTDGNSQLWVHLTSGGAPLQITRDPSQHLDPRWSSDSASIIYYSPPREGEGGGALWEVSALGGAPRKLASALTEADVSHDGKRLAFFRLEDGKTQLVTSDRDGSNVRPVASYAAFSYSHPRWSPDDRTIAFTHSVAAWSDDIYLVAADGGDAKKLTDENNLISGMAWLPDGSGVIYSTAHGNTTLYLPIMHLFLQRLDHTPAVQLTFDDVGYHYPDIGRNGQIVVSRWRMSFDIWKFPVNGDPAENAKHGVRITQQTGQVQTPTLSPDESEIAFLSDSGGHGNIWIKDLHHGELRQLTHERDLNTTIGVPIWSPDGKNIAFASTRNRGNGNGIGYWTIQPDGSELRNPVQEGSWATWAPDSKWLYYAQDAPTKAASRFDILKAPVAGGAPQVVRSDGGSAPMLSPDGQTLYFIVPLPVVNGRKDYEIRRAKPEGGESQLLTKIDSSRLPVWQGLHPVISHNGRELALTLNDSYGTNLWTLATDTGKLRKMVDFGQRRTFIARRVSWSNDDRWIYAAVGEGDADIVSLVGLVATH